jgi:phosphoglycolate phosphatase-like HAD superfamily hydrolase
MARHAVIFDLDQILIDSSLVEPLRQDRKWGEVYKTIPRLKPYDGISQLLQWLAKRGVVIGIVTSRPGRYCELIVKRWSFPVNARVCFGDTPLRKPSPEPVLACLKKLGVTPNEAVAVGVDIHDVRAARAAGVYAVVAQWGSGPQDSVLQACPDAECATVDELKAGLTKHFKL